MNNSKEYCIDFLIDNIKKCTQEIKLLSEEKKTYEEKLKEALNHKNIDGSKTYRHKDLSIKITTGLNHIVDVEKYNNFKHLLNEKFNPVKEVIKYELNKKTIRDCYKNGTDKDIWYLSKFLTSSEKKLHISLTDKKKETSENEPNFLNGDL